MRDLNRRSFLRLSGGVASSAMLAAGLGSASLLAGCGREAPEARNGAGSATGNGSSVNNQPFGLQLYTLRDVIEADPKAILREVASYGYRQIESYEGPQGVYWGMGNKGFKTYLDELGMEMISSHVNNFNDFDSFKTKVEEAAEIGAQYLICPYAKQETLDDYRALADDFNRAGEIARNAGIRFAYHNHGYTFERVNGEYPQDLLMERTDADLVDFEMDMYWLAAVNADPAEWLRKYPGRFKLAHVKDLKRNGEPETATLGEGELDWESLLPMARSHGTGYFIVEQEHYTGTSPMEAVKNNAEYLRGISY